MFRSKLPAELVSLVQYVELNKIGWWDKIVQHLITAVIWLSGKSLSVEGIADELKRSFSIDIDNYRLRSQIAVLCSNKTLVALPNDQFKISEQSLKGFEQEVKNTEEVEKRTRESFVAAIRDCCPTLEPEEVWLSFNEGFLIPLIQEAGARLYELISSSPAMVYETVSFADFLQKYPSETHVALRNAVVLFWDPKKLHVRQYVLRYLNAYLFLEASNLQKETLDTLAKMAEHPPSFTIFVDTNFLFSILGIHENPSNEAAQSLLNLIRQIANKVTVKLCILPPTVEEAKRVLRWYNSTLSGLNLTPYLSDVAVESSLGGIILKFVQECRRAGRALRIEDYLAPYLTDLVQVAKSKGIEFLDEDLVAYATKKEVVDDILTQQQYEEKRPVGTRIKSYETIEHDMILWHFTKDKRPSYIESPLEAGYWITTVDFRFLGFDAYKRKSQGEIPVCLHPATLTQIFQFWVARSQSLEEAMLSSLQLPLLSHDFDIDAEKATIRILESLSRFENVNNLSKETLSRIMVNEALRQKISGVADIQKQIELVREALIEENKRVESELQSAKGEVSNLRNELGTKGKRIGELENRVMQLEGKLEEGIKQETERKVLGEFRQRWVILPLILILLVSAGLSYMVTSLVDVRFWQAFIGLYFLLLIPWAYLADRRGSRIPVIANWKPFSALRRFRLWVFGAIVTVTLAVLGNAIWEALKSLFHF
jgi:hypothetical protein